MCVLKVLVALFSSQQLMTGYRASVLHKRPQVALRAAPWPWVTSCWYLHKAGVLVSWGYCHRHHRLRDSDIRNVLSPCWVRGRKF